MSENKKNNKLPMPGKVKKGFRFYVVAILALTMIMGMSSEAGYEKLIAKVPLKEMSSYSTALSSLTGGRASFIMKFASYELVPSDVQDKLIKEFEAKQADE